MSTTFQSLPPEILLRVFSFLETCDLLQLTRTTHGLRRLARDPILHDERLQYAAHALSRSFAHRPSRSSISPPNAWILLNKTHLMSRRISRSLSKIRLTHCLELRPSAQELVSRGILSSVCINYSSAVSPVLMQSRQSVERKRLKDRLVRKFERRPSLSSLVSLNIMPEECAKRVVSPLLVAASRKVIKERVKDGLRAWVERRAVHAQKCRSDQIDASETKNVKALVRRFAAKTLACDLERQVNPLVREKNRAHEKWGRQAGVVGNRESKRTDGACAQPARAHVLGLRRFWEGFSQRGHRAGPGCPDH